MMMMIQCFLQSCFCVSRALDVSQQQQWNVLEQQLRFQISQLESALNADLLDKNEILDKVKAERGSCSSDHGWGGRG